ncbi:MAG TPA: hypothetical protein VM600_01840 [Actinomycetota bacterium]|nr:hypothetical protein [Actinomycetota bacterium]
MIYRPVTLVIAALMACNSGAQSPTATEAVTLTEEQISVGTILTLEERIRDVELEVEFLDGRGDTVGQTTDSVASCPRRCVWGGTFVGEQFGAHWRTVERARIRIAESARGDAAPPLEITVARATDGSVGGIALDTGWIHVIARGRTATAGASVSASKGDRFTIPAAYLPRVEDERFFAMLYPGPIGAHD